MPVQQIIPKTESSKNNNIHLLVSQYLSQEFGTSSASFPHGVSQLVTVRCQLRLYPNEGLIGSGRSISKVSLT